MTNSARFMILPPASCGAGTARPLLLSPIRSYFPRHEGMARASVPPEARPALQVGLPHRIGAVPLVLGDLRFPPLDPLEVVGDELGDDRLEPRPGRGPVRARDQVGV